MKILCAIFLLFSLMIQPAMGQAGNFVDFEKDEYLFLCSVPPAYSYFSIGMNMVGPYSPNWIYIQLEYDDGLIVNPNNIEIGLGWLEPELVEITTGYTTPDIKENAVYALFESSLSIFAPPAHLCNFKLLYSENGNCFSGEIAVLTYWRHSPMSGAYQCPTEYVEVIGIPNTNVQHKTWGNIKALYRITSY